MVQWLGEGVGGVAGQNIDQYVYFVAVAKKVICTISCIIKYIAFIST